MSTKAQCSKKRTKAEKKKKKTKTEDLVKPTEAMELVEPAEQVEEMKEVDTKEEPRDDDMRGKKAKGWFMTFSDCPIKKETMLELLRKRLGDQGYQIKEYIICEEIAPSTKKPHLHCFIKVDRTMRWTKDRFDVRDMNKTWHGSYEVAKSWIKSERYCKKDGNYISNIDIESAKKKKGKMKKEDLLRDIDEVLDEGLINPMQVNSFYKNQCTYKMLLNKKRKLPEVMPPKKRHLWMYGCSNTGKTERLRKWIKNMGEENCFQMPYNGDWVGYSDQKYLYCDEFNGQINPQDLNRICDGGAKVNVKGSTVELRYDVEVVVVSNFVPKVAMDKYKLDEVTEQAILNRFHLQRLEYDPDYDKKKPKDEVLGDDSAKEPAQNKDVQNEDIPDEVLDELL